LKIFVLKSKKLCRNGTRLNVTPNFQIRNDTAVPPIVVDETSNCWHRRPCAFPRGHG